VQKRSFQIGFRSWRYAGEEAAVVIYAKSIKKTLLLQCCGFAVFFLAFQQFIWSLVVVAMIVLPRTLAEGRRAIIFTETEVIYRPPLGSPRRVLIATIRDLVISPVLITYFLRTARRPGVIMTLRDGATEAWPLDFEGRDEILQRLSLRIKVQPKQGD
jgi:hypothetical protein